MLPCSCSVTTLTPEPGPSQEHPAGWAGDLPMSCLQQRSTWPFLSSHWLPWGGVTTVRCPFHTCSLMIPNGWTHMPFRWGRFEPQTNAERSHPGGSVKEELLKVGKRSPSEEEIRGQKWESYWSIKLWRLKEAASLQLCLVSASSLDLQSLQSVFTIHASLI